MWHPCFPLKIKKYLTKSKTPRQTNNKVKQLSTILCLCWKFRQSTVAICGRQGHLQGLRGLSLHNVASQEGEEDAVDEQGQVVEEAAKGVPLVVEQGCHQGVVQQNLSL